MWVRLVARIFANAATLRVLTEAFTRPARLLPNLFLRQVGDDFGERFVSEGKRDLLAAPTGFLVSAEAAERGRLRPSKKNLKVGNNFLPPSGLVAPQQRFVALRIDFDHAQ